MAGVRNRYATAIARLRKRARQLRADGFNRRVVLTLPKALEYAANALRVYGRRSRRQ